MEDKIIIGLDQATKITGYSIFKNDKLYDYGTFKTTKDTEVARINEIKKWLISLIQLYKPNLVGVEGIQMQDIFGVTTFETLAHLQGVIVDALYENEVEYQICHTASWRAHCKVKGKSRKEKKESMQNIVKENYNLIVTDDEADAIGIGKYTCDKSKNKIINWE